jgi:hypothetical protein
MKQLTQKEIKTKIESFISNQGYSVRRDWNSKHCGSIARTYKDQLWYFDNVLKTFPESTISINQDGNLLVTYSTGSARIEIKALEWEVLIPYIQDVCRKHNRQFNLQHPALMAA